MAKSLSSREIIKVLLEKGFVLKNIEGSHYRYEKAGRRELERELNFISLLSEDVKN